MKIQVLIDNPNSWIWPHMEQLVADLKVEGREIELLGEADKVVKGNVLFLVSCVNKFDHLGLNDFNLVIHESDLPQGKGWSPLTWQVLEGVNEIPITLFEANDRIDAGEIYFQDVIKLEGHELIDEIRIGQALATQRLIKKFIDKYPNFQGMKQTGKESFYPKRTENDSELDLSKSINEQFNLLRVVDNERYPAYFVKDGVKYILKIEKG